MFFLAIVPNTIRQNRTHHPLVSTARRYHTAHVAFANATAARKYALYTRYDIMRVARRRKRLIYRTGVRRRIIIIDYNIIYRAERASTRLRSESFLGTAQSRYIGIRTIQ